MKFCKKLMVGIKFNRSRPSFIKRSCSKQAVLLCTAFLFPIQSAFALECTGSNGIAELLWGKRENSLKAQYQAETWKSSEEELPRWRTLFADNFKLGASYGDVVAISTAGTRLAVADAENDGDDDKTKLTWTLSYELPSAKLFGKPKPDKHPNPDELEKAYIQKEEIAFYELIGDWRIANHKFEKAKAVQDKFAMQEAQLVMDKLRKKINLLSRDESTFTSTTCI